MGEQLPYEPTSPEATAVPTTSEVAPAVMAKEGATMSPQLEAAVKALEGQGVTLADFHTDAVTVEASQPPQEWSFTNNEGKLVTLTKEDSEPGGTPDGKVHYNVNF